MYKFVFLLNACNVNKNNRLLPCRACLSCSKKNRSANVYKMYKILFCPYMSIEKRLIFNSKLGMVG